jgi:hypothetical protein
VLFRSPLIEPISEHTPDQIPLGKSQRLDRVSYESPTLPLSYSAVLPKLTWDVEERQLRVVVRFVRYTSMPTEARYSAGVDPDSRLPYPVRLPIDGGLILKVRDSWPRISRVF